MEPAITTIVRAMLGDVDFQVSFALKETVITTKSELLLNPSDSKSRKPKPRKMQPSITTIVRAMFGDVDFQVPFALEETIMKLKETFITT